MSGAQWSAERLRELAACQGAAGYPIQREIADALRAFARVVSVLGSLDIERRANAIAFGRADDGGSYAAQFYDTHEGDWSDVYGTGDNPLAAILALADALDAGRGDADDADDA